MNEFDLDKELFTVLKGVLNKQTCEIISNEMVMYRNKLAIEAGVTDLQSYSPGDELVKNSFSLYAPLAVESAMKYLTPIVSEVSGKTLVPGYSYARIYYNGAEMAMHRDRPSCQYSVSIPISVDETQWDIWVRRDDMDIVVPLEVGDAIFYRGDKIFHWREKYEGAQQIQMFLHWVDADGEYAHWALDWRPALGFPANPEMLSLKNSGKI
jgi:hypothetical protein